MKFTLFLAVFFSQAGLAAQGDFFTDRGSVVKHSISPDLSNGESQFRLTVERRSVDYIYCTGTTPVGQISRIKKLAEFSQKRSLPLIFILEENNNRYCIIDVQLVDGK